MTTAELLAFIANLVTLGYTPTEISAIVTALATDPSAADELEAIKDAIDDQTATQSADLAAIESAIASMPDYTSQLDNLDTLPDLAVALEEIAENSTIAESTTAEIITAWGNLFEGLGFTLGGIGGALEGGGALAEGIGQMNTGNAELVRAGTEAHEVNTQLSWGYGHVTSENNDYIVVRPDMERWGVVGTQDAVTGW